jgi:hypothetical protein
MFSVKSTYKHLCSNGIDRSFREDLTVVGASEILPPDVQVHLALSVEQGHDRPLEKAAASLPQLKLDRRRTRRIFLGAT